jgi:serine/threonine protein kinase/Tfp pilus assembly protein PilF
MESIQNEPIHGLFTFYLVMGKTRLDQIENIYQAAADQPPDKRSLFLDEACGSDEALRHEVESLLHYDGQSADFIDSPPALLAAEIFGKDDERPPLLGGQVGHYKIESLLGEGGMGEVYLAEDTRLHRRVALKVFPQSVVADAERLMRFEREAQAASALNHPNILTVHEFGEGNGIHFIASEFVEGLTLRHKLDTGRLAMAEALDVAIQISSALSAAHEAGITHRDIKPENIMIRPDGYAKVLDFGLAKLTQHQPSSISSGSEDLTRALHRTRPGAVMGTAAYMSPEQARGRHVDARTDIWSLGAVVYEMLTGHRPFAGETSADMIVSVLSSEPPPMSSYVTGLPAELEWMVTKALSKDVEERYQTSKELRADLDKIRKRIEFDENLSRSGGGSQGGRSGEEETILPVGGGVPTSGGEASPTSGGEDGSPETRSFWSSPSVEVVFRQARTHKLSSSIAALVIVALVSSAVYLVFVNRSIGPIDSIAVLPFEVIGGDGELAYISDGLSSTLIDRLSQLPQLKVISRNSSFKFHGPNINIRDVAAQLGARAIVTGTVARIGDDVSIRIDIVDAVEDKHLTGGQYRRKAGDVLRIDNEIAQAASEQLRVKLTDPQRTRLAENSTEDSEAYRYYLSGLVELNGPQDVRSRAVEYFERAVELDPNFAAAYAEIAWVYWSRANGSDDPHELMPKAKAAVERALAIDPDLAKAHVVRAMLDEYDFDWPGAQTEYQRAIELSPNLDFAHNNYAFFLSVMGRQAEALGELEQQAMRDPINRRLGLLQKGIVLTQARKFDEALAVYREAQAVEPGRDIPNFSLGYAYAGKGLYSQAAEYYKKSVDLLGREEKYSQPLVYLAATYAKIPEKRNEARAMVKQIEATGGYASPALLAIVYSALDDNDKAMELLEQAYVKRDLLLRFIGTGYEYDELRGDPRFVDLTKRIGLVSSQL